METITGARLITALQCVRITGTTLLALQFTTRDSTTEPTTSPWFAMSGEAAMSLQAELAEMTKALLAEGWRPRC